MSYGHISYNIQTKWFAEAWGMWVGGGISKKTFPVSIKFNYKIWLFPAKFEVFVV